MTVANFPTPNLFPSPTLYPGAGYNVLYDLILTSESNLIPYKFDTSILQTQSQQYKLDLLLNTLQSKFSKLDVVLSQLKQDQKAKFDIMFDKLYENAHKYDLNLESPLASSSMLLDVYIHTANYPKSTTMRIGRSQALEGVLRWHT